MANRVERRRRDIARLLPKVALAVNTYIGHRLAENPHRLSKRLSGELAASAQRPKRRLPNPVCGSTINSRRSGSSASTTVARAYRER